jgi:hypothetical protein
VTIRIEAQESKKNPAEWDWAILSDLLMSKDGVVGVELWDADWERSTIATKEKQLRGVADRYVGSVMVVHATDQGAANKVLGALLAALPESSSKTTQCGIYRLAFFAQNATM